MNDPPQLRPYSIYTYPSYIDWDSLGFENVPRRTIAKIINVSFTENGLELNINWERRREKIEELKRKKSNVYPAESPLDFREDVYKKGNKNLQKIKKWKLSTKQICARTKSLTIISLKIYWYNSQYSFAFSPKIKSQINRAEERFHEFERQISKRSKLC
ncbi:Bromodomain containing protein [Histomonas meleagridis]|uniref:Bromodomain containing protein n=1 Tax=Histomonas meleagridis TaxID=135588 RepID=UPI00355A8C9B|nr:Bromodomain containing protein [Histomonas meleagridis]KAH0803653.1 Bromodomain containing protein [Histomonas meleagridis]